MNVRIYLLAAIAFLSALQPAYSQKHSHLHIVTTGDVHGAYFDQPFIPGEPVETSMMSAKVIVDSIRQAAGKDNVLLVDAGDILPSDIAAGYFNSADSAKSHIVPRIAEYMGYDALILGNCDLEPGHPVYDRIFSELRDRSIPWLGGNVLKVSDGSTYFPLYRIFKKAGVKVAVFGFVNANMKELIGGEAYEGMDFLPLVPYAQSLVDYVVKKEKPQVVIVVAHTGSGNGDNSQLEDQGMALFNTLKGVDLLVTAHDHKSYVTSKQGMGYINAGGNVGNVGHAVIDMTYSGKTIIAKEVGVELCPVNKGKVDWVMQSAFREDFDAVIRHLESSKR